MTHRRTRRPLPPAPPTGYCQACDKVIYYKRADAKAAAERQPQRQRVYPCPDNEDHYHRASWQPPGRVAFYREREARSNEQEEA